MSDSTPRLNLAQLVSMQELNAVTWNEALAQLDTLVDLCLKGQFVNTPPASPSDGDAYLVGGTPTGAWTGQAYKIASCLDGAWRFYAPFNGLRAYVTTTGAFIVYLNGAWTDWNSLISANEVSVASASTCDLGAAGSLFVQVTGNTTITSFGSGTNKLRYVRFAAALTLTHNAASLILLGGASRITAAGDVGLYASDGSGNWRERSYFRAAVNAGDAATRSGAETLSGKTFSGVTSFPGNTVIDGSGRLGVGTASPGQLFTVGSNSQFTVNTGASAGMVVVQAQAPATDYTFVIKSPSGTTALAVDGNGLMQYAGDQNFGSNNLIVGTNQDLRLQPGLLALCSTGSVGWSATTHAYDTRDTSLSRGAAGKVYVGTGAAGNCGGTLIAGSLGIGTATLNAGAALDVAGSIYPHTDNSCNLGSGTYRWGTVYAATGTINTSGAAAKTAVRALGAAELAVARALAGNVRLYQFLDAVARKGDAARLHAGMVAEEVFAAFAAAGLDPFRYGVCCRDPAVKAVERNRVILRPRIETVSESVPAVTVRDGCAVLSKTGRQVQREVAVELPLFDETGAPVVDPLTAKQAVVRQPVMEEVTETWLESVPDLDDGGAPRWVLGLRADELAAFVMAGLAARLAALEAR